jgi:hypothetical protein
MYNSSNIILKNNIITLTSGFLHWLKICNEMDIIKKIFEQISKYNTIKQSIDVVIDDIQYSINNHYQYAD